MTWVQNLPLLSASSRFGCPLFLACWPQRVILSSQISRFPSWPSPQSGSSPSGWCCHPTTQRSPAAWRLLNFRPALEQSRFSPDPSICRPYPSLPEARVLAPPLFICHQAILHSIRPPKARLLLRSLVWIAPFSSNPPWEAAAQSHQSHRPPRWRKPSAGITCCWTAGPVLAS